MSTDAWPLFKSIGSIDQRTTVPSCLRDRHQWIVWRPVGDKKVPCDPETGTVGVDATDPETWLPYENALETVRKDGYGLGYVLTEDGPAVFIDFDNVRNQATGELHPVAQGMIDQADSWADISVSGTGVHILVNGALPDDIRIPKTDLPNHPDYPHATMEVYESGRFIAMSGEKLPDTSDDLHVASDLMEDLVEDYGRETADTPETDNLGETAAPNLDLVAKAEAALRDFHNDSKTTQRARTFLHDLLHGRYKKRGFENDDGDADRSKAEFTLAGLLYGAFCRYGERETAPDLVRAYISHACRENQHADDGRPRKWIKRGARYRRKTIAYAVARFDQETWERWRQKRGTWRTWTDDYSDLTYDAVRDALAILAKSEPYPTKREVVDLAPHLW